MVKRTWFWLITATILALLVLVGVWFTRQRGISVEVQERIEFSNQVTDKFNANKFGTTPAQVDKTSTEPFSSSLTCTAQSFSTDKLELAEGFYSIFTANCYYRDVNNRERSIRLPLVVTNGQQMVITGFEIQEYDPDYERLMNTEADWSAFLEDRGFIGHGHIFIPHLEKADPSRGAYGTFRGLGAEAMARYYSEQDFVNFANTGDPRYLNGILWTPDVGLVNTLNTITPERLPNITPL
jgi:hypothetical protein